MDQNDDEKEVFCQTWGKLKNSLHQEGFREGSSAGRDETFQNGFDLGYEDGFKIGYKLGLHNGILKYFSSGGSHLDIALKKQLFSVQAHENPNRGLCVVCVEEQQAGNSVEIDSTNSEVIPLSDIRESQNKAVKDNEKSLCNENFTAALKSLKLDNLFD